MDPLVYKDIYKTPDEYQPPEETDLAENTHYPNLNSRDYAKRPLNHTLRMHNAWECISLNENGHALIATNKLNGREWTGTLWGFEKLEQIERRQEFFKLQCNSLITKLQYVSANIFLIALHSGKLQVWTIRTDEKDKKPYSLFLIGEKCEHIRTITSMDVMATNVNKAVTGSADGTIKLWDMACADLFSTHTFRFAHTNAITSIAASPTDDSEFATCSSDKSALLWDDRLPRPATALYENHKVAFRALSWVSHSSQPIDENYVYIGDESGYVHSIDKRCPNAFLNSTQYFNRPIRKILLQRNNMAIIANTNTIKISNIETQTILYENSDADNYLRDCVWYGSNELLTVGFDGKLHKHKLL